MVLLMLSFKTQKESVEIYSHYILYHRVTVSIR
jgi:hypothetical protein